MHLLGCGHDDNIFSKAGLQDKAAFIEAGHARRPLRVDLEVGILARYHDAKVREYLQSALGDIEAYQNAVAAHPW